MRKSIVITAFVISALYLSFPFVFTVTVCKENCSCCCGTVEKKEAASCCTVQVVVTSDCCNTEISHQRKTFHFSVVFDNEIYRNNPFALPTYIFNNDNFLEQFRIACEKQVTPIYIVYDIFRPPKV